MGILPSVCACWLGIGGVNGGFADQANKRQSLLAPLLRLLATQFTQLCLCCVMLRCAVACCASTQAMCASLMTYQASHHPHAMHKRPRLLQVKPHLSCSRFKGTCSSCCAPTVCTLSACVCAHVCGLLGFTLQEVLASPSVAPVTTKLECAKLADGAAALVLVPADTAAAAAGTDSSSSRGGVGVRGVFLSDLSTQRCDGGCG